MKTILRGGGDPYNTKKTQSHMFVVLLPTIKDLKFCCVNLVANVLFGRILKTAVIFALDFIDIEL